MQCNYIMSLNMHHNNINTEYVKASAEALFNGTIAGGCSHAGELILEWRNLKCWLRDWHISKTAGPPALTVTHCAKQQWHTWRPGLVGPDTAQEQQTRACAHIWISHICTARGHNQLTATSVASLSKQLADIKESIPPKDDAIPGQARQKVSPVINRKYLSGCHKIRAHRCTDRLIVDKSRKNATTPISSLCRIPRMASLPSAPWSGRDLASASQTAHTDTKRSKREMQLAGILAATSLVPDRRPCVHISDFFPPFRRLWMEPRCCRLCGLRLVFIVWGGAQERELRFPLLISSGTATHLHYSDTNLDPSWTLNREVKVPAQIVIINY